jgi:hypothetical protein
MPVPQSHVWSIQFEIYLFLRIDNGKHFGRFVSPSEAEQYVSIADLVHVKIAANETLTLSMNEDGSVKFERGRGPSDLPDRRHPRFDVLLPGMGGKVFVPTAGTVICACQTCLPTFRICPSDMPYPDCSTGSLECTDHEPPG